MDNVDDGEMCKMIVEEVIKIIQYDETIKQKKEMESLLKKRKLNFDIREEIIQLIQNTILKYNATRIKEKENKSNAQEELKECIEMLWYDISSSLGEKLRTTYPQMKLEKRREYLSKYRKKIVYHSERQIMPKLKGIVEPKKLRSSVMKSSNPSKLFLSKTKGDSYGEENTDAEYDLFCSRMYNNLKRNKQFHCFDPVENRFEEFATYLKRELDHNLICKNINASAGDPTKFFKRAKNNEPEFGIHSDMSEEEKEAFDGCIKQLEMGEIGDLWIQKLPGVGQVLYTKSQMKAGCIFTAYIGRYLWKGEIDFEKEFFKKNNGENGHDLALGVFSHKNTEDLDTMIFPFRFGGIAQFASTCSPIGDDFRNVNCIAVPVLIECKDGNQVQIFLVAIKDIEPSHPIVWFYKSNYFNNPELKVPKWLTVSELTDLLQQHLNESK